MAHGELRGGFADAAFAAEIDAQSERRSARPGERLRPNDGVDTDIEIEQTIEFNRRAVVPAPPYPEWAEAARLLMPTKKPPKPAAFYNDVRAKTGLL